MEFFSALIGIVTSWFGVAPAEPMPEPVPIVEEVTIEDQMAKDEVVEVVETVEAEVIEESEVEEQPTDEAGLSAVDSMTGNAKPVAEAPASQPEPEPEPEPVAEAPAKLRTALVAGGCFWCVEADLEKTYGVVSAVSGYAGGDTANPTYDDYGEGGHREVVEVTYDANKISFEDILIVTMKTTDPTDDDGTFKDRGDKYSSAFYYENDEQKEIIENLIAEVDEFGPYDAPLAIDVEPRATFWPAEDFHQDYYKGTFSKIKYNAYRLASGRTAFIQKYWGVNDHSTELPWRTEETTSNNQTYMWSNYVKPSKDELKEMLDPLAFKVTQEDGTERAGSSDLDKNWEDGIYVDILSGEPLYSSKDKFDSGTGWPSFVKPITPDALTEHEDRKLFTVRTETRSAIADNHIGHVFTDGPADRGGLRYCMNGVALKFIPKAEMEANGYGDFLQYI